jgi:hypothetical protein
MPESTHSTRGRSRFFLLGELDIPFFPPHFSAEAVMEEARSLRAVAHEAYSSVEHPVEQIQQNVRRLPLRPACPAPPWHAVHPREDSHVLCHSLRACFVSTRALPVPAPRSGFVISWRRSIL